jgi:hypothetical protein
MVLAGESDEFHRYFGGGLRRLEACVGGIPVGGEVLRVETDTFRRVRRVDVRLERPCARDLLARLLRSS